METLVAWVIEQTDPVTAILLIGLVIYIRRLANDLRLHMKEERIFQDKIDTWVLYHATDHAIKVKS
jgi:hypothetical protein